MCLTNTNTIMYIQIEPRLKLRLLEFRIRRSDRQLAIRSTIPTDIGSLRNKKTLMKSDSSMEDLTGKTDNQKIRLKKIFILNHFQSNYFLKSAFFISSYCISEDKER